MGKILEVVHPNGELWFFTSEDELKSHVNPRRVKEVKERNPHKQVVARESLRSADGYVLTEGELYAVLEEFKQESNLYYVVAQHGHAVAWLAKHFRERYLN